MGGFAVCGRRGRRRTHGGGQKGRDTCGFPSSLNSYLSLGKSGADGRYVTAPKRGTAEGFSSAADELPSEFVLLSNLFAVSDTILLHMWLNPRKRNIPVLRNSLTRYTARHLRIRYLAQFIFVGPVYYNVLTTCAALLCRALRGVARMCSSTLSVNCEYVAKQTQE